MASACERAGECECPKRPPSPLAAGLCHLANGELPAIQKVRTSPHTAALAPIIWPTEKFPPSK
eukprot:2952230-Prymnesium_polylepis.1